MNFNGHIVKTSAKTFNKFISSIAEGLSKPKSKFIMHLSDLAKPYAKKMGNIALIRVKQVIIVLHCGQPLTEVFEFTKTGLEIASSLFACKSRT